MYEKFEDGLRDGDELNTLRGASPREDMSAESLRATPPDTIGADDFEDTAMQEQAPDTPVDATDKLAQPLEDTGRAIGAAVLGKDERGSDAPSLQPGQNTANLIREAYRLGLLSPQGGITPSGAGKQSDPVLRELREVADATVASWLETTTGDPIAREVGRRFISSWLRMAKAMPQFAPSADEAQQVLDAQHAEAREAVAMGLTGGVSVELTQHNTTEELKEALALAAEVGMTPTEVANIGRTSSLAHFKAVVAGVAERFAYMQQEIEEQRVSEKDLSRSTILQFCQRSSSYEQLSERIAAYQENVEALTATYAGTLTRGQVAKICRSTEQPAQAIEDKIAQATVMHASLETTVVTIEDAIYAAFETGNARAAMLRMISITEPIEKALAAGMNRSHIRRLVCKASSITAARTVVNTLLEKRQNAQRIVPRYARQE